MVNKKKNKFIKKLKDSERDTFQYSVAYQLELLKYIVQQQDAILIISKIKSTYFTILEHNLICEAIIRAFKKYKKVVSKSILLEFTKDMLNTTEFVSLVTQDDLPNLNTIINNIYDETLNDPDIIRNSLKEFIAYIEMRDLSTSVDFTNFNNIKEYYHRVSRLIRETEENNVREQTLYMVDGLVNRQLRRKVDPDVIPTPYKQLNALTNAGGYDKGSIIVLLDKAKARKTFTMLNVARGYMAMKKNVLYIDTENGAAQIMDRLIQSTLNRTKLDVLSGDVDHVEKRHMRKYKKLKTEFMVRRVVALVDDVNTIKTVIKEVEEDRGIKIHMLFVDYAGKLASTLKDKDDFERISNVYIDLDNLAHEVGLEAIWTAHHITREGSKHSNTRYEEHDISGAISIIRNAQAVIGLNQTQEELENNVQRMEVVVQRDGKPQGRAVFHLDVDKQRMREFTKEQRKAYDETQGLIVDELINNGSERGSRKSVNKNADINKAANKGGDI